MPDDFNQPASTPEEQKAHELARPALDAATRDFYLRVLSLLESAEISTLVGGAFAFEAYTGIARGTKDFDLFLRRGDCARALDVLRSAGYPGELTFPHWLAKAFSGDSADAMVDLIFSGGNGVAAVDDEWFEHAVKGKVLGAHVRMIPAEEMVWSKAYVMERERYDGADIMHLFRSRGPQLDWRRLMRRMNEHWQVLFSHVVLFGFIYPGERQKVPGAVVEELMRRFEEENTQPPGAEKICYGTLLSRQQYLAEVVHWGYEDPRLEPRGRMTPEERAIWTKAIGEIP